MGSPHIDEQLLLYKYISISALSCSFEFVVVWVVMVFPAITLSQPNYSYDCFVVGVVQSGLFCEMVWEAKSLIAIGL